ncbi:MAG: PilZ domain-containing protein [Candidatus Omnitrophica bacterium]|nr:PilZ domain-containing protein [Candidatus Omnitrophota bacterium]MDD5672190.1 PilZ domain-containing protein [Candidatus Omnitrophota bacterium]
MAKVRKSVPKKKKQTIPVLGSRNRPLRKHARVLVMMSTQYDRSKNTVVFTENISMGGVFLETGDILASGTKVKLWLTLGGRFPEPVQINGKVIWSRKKFAGHHTGNKSPGMGIAFEGCSPKGLKILKEFFESVETSGWFL